MLFGCLSRLQRVWTRIFGLVILPAALPGDVMEEVGDLLEHPLRTIKSWSWPTVKQLVWQVLSSQKVTLDDDPQLLRLQKFRNRYVGRGGWASCPLRTADGVQLDAMLHPPPPSKVDAPRYVIFVGGNFQKYEDWLSYFDSYANDGGVGFLCFNFRGVGRSEGAVTCCADMLADVQACVDHVLVERGAKPEHVLLHGFSIGGAIATLFCAEPGAPPLACTNERSFRSFSHVAFAVVRGAYPPLGALRPAPPTPRPTPPPGPARSPTPCPPLRCAARRPRSASASPRRIAESRRTSPTSPTSPIPPLRGAPMPRPASRGSSSGCAPWSRSSRSSRAAGSRGTCARRRRGAKWQAAR